ncbi:MAG: TonB-dependent receptor [Candidatus Hydrogenedentes bacterium]|nr:TonB-dependent receptor [Candidatus Hydrogenedentota bacterium]
MRNFKLTISALALALASGWVQQSVAQEAAAPPPPAAEEVTELPGIVVETSPAKRNVKKAKLRKSAPQPGGQAAEVAGDGGLEQQVVEGEKIVRTLRDTTTSIGIVTGDQIRTEQIEDLQGALNSQANVLSTEGSGGNSGFTIRGLNSEGLTNNNNPSAAPLVSVVIDGATQNPEATRRGARGLWDVEQVEVLRGPQSALQARNSLAGTVFIKSKDPTYKWEAIVEGTAGGQDLQSGGFVLNAPIVAGQSALRFSGQSFERNHSISYANPEDDPLDEDVLRTFRGKLLLEPDSLPGLSALFTIARVKDTPAVLSVSQPFEDRFHAGGSTEFRATETTNYISDVGYTVTPGITLRSITAYADTDTTIDTGASALFQRNTERTGGDFTQDLRVEIENSGNGLSGVAGLFYGSFKFKADSFDTIDISEFNLPGGPPPGFITTTVQDLVTDVETESMAAYADLRYRFWDRFVLIGGGRLLRDDVKSSVNGDIFPELPIYTGGMLPAVTLQNNFHDEFTEFLPRAGLTYDLTKDQTVGFTYNKGYRNGYTEFNINTGLFNTVKPEFLDAYELSYRSTWANNTLSFNANAFYYDYKDQQVAFDEDLFGMLPYPVTVILNADSSYAYGSELEARWRPISPLELYGSVGLMRTEFESFSTPAYGNFTGNEFPEAPAYTIAAGGLWKDRTGWFVGANVRYTDGYYSGGDLGNSALRFVDGYTLVDARVGYEWEKYTLTVFAKNLFDENYVTSKSLGTPPTLGTAGDEQLFGVTLRGTF